MAVNDLMMRIQLLVDSGRSSAELNRIQRSLADLNKSLKSLENTKISVLSNSLESLKSAASSLRSVNLQNFTRTIDEVKKSFSGLGATTQGLDNLKTAFQQLSQQANANSLKQYQSDLKKVTAQLREAKQLTLTKANPVFNYDYAQLTRDLSRYNSAIITSSKEIANQRREVLRLKNDLSSISKVKFDSNLVLELSKLNNNRNLRNQPLSVIDRTTIGNLQDYNSKLSENQKALLVANSKAEGYRQTLAKLRLEAQRFAIPDLTVGGTRNLVTDLNSAQSAIAQLRTSGIIPLENSIRSLQAKSSFNKVINIDPIRANVKLARAELALLSNEASKQLIIGGKDDPTYLNKKKRIKDINEQILKDNLQIAQLEKRALTNINSKIARQQLSLAAKKNELALDKDQEQSIKALIAQQKQSAQLAAQAVKTRIFDITKSNNNIKSEANLYKKNLQALKQYLSERKAAAQVDIDAAKSQLYSAQVILAQKQLTKAEYAAERAEIKANMAIEKEKSRVYQEGLRANQQSLRESITAEREKTRSLLSDIRNARQLATEEGNIVKIRLQQELLQSRKGRTDLREQIKQTEDLTKVELNRLAVIERIANGSSRSSANQNVGFAIKETQRIIDETTKRLSDLAVKSEAAKVKLGQIGTGSDLPTLNTQIKQTISDLKSLKQAGLTGTQPYSDIERQLSNLREQRALLRQIASIDLKTASGQVELKGLQQTINQLREAQREMSKLQQFARGFSQGFTFALQPDQLGMAAFNTLQQVLSELGRSFIQVNKETETLTRGLTAVFGAGQGEVQFEKLVGLANTYGLALHDLSRNYLSLNASSKGTILEGQESEKIFRSLSAAMAVLGADTLTTQRAFRAVSQMISKGQVYAEELKGQLAEALPGAIQIFARSMGKTSQEFLAMVKAGNVGLTELIPFFQQVEQEYGKAATASTTYEQATNRLSNAFSILLKNAGDTGAWKAIIAIVNEAGAAVNIVANNMGTIAQNVNTIFARLKTMGVGLRSNQEVSLDTKKAETNVDSLSNKLRVFDAYLKAPSSFILPLFTGVANEGLAQLEQSVKDFKLSTIQDLSQVTAMSEEMFNKIKSSPESFDAVLPVGTYQDYLKSIDEVNQKIKEENRLRAEKRANYQADVASIYMETQAYKDKLAAFKASTEARSGYGFNDVGIDEKKLALTKQQINATKSLLNTQQQGQTALYAVESQRAALSLKSSGSSAAIIAEAKSALSLKNAYTELAKAKQIEANIKTGSKDKKEDSTPDQIKLIRELTVDQLKYALTVARTANNYSLTLAILQELSRVQTEIATEPAINPLAGFKTASYDTVQGLEKIIERLKEVTKEGSKAAGQIYKMLALVEQQNKINTLKTTGKYKYELDDLKREIEYNEKNVKANDKVSEKKREAIVLGNASLALAKAEEIFGKMKRTNNDAELAQLREVYAEYVNISKAQASSASDKKAKPIFEQLQALEEQFSKFQKKADATNLNAMEESTRQLADSLGNVKDASGNLDFTSAFGALESNLKVASDEFSKLKIQLASMKETDPDFGITKAAMEEAARKANGLRTELENVRTAYQGLASTGQVPTIEFKPVLSSDIDNEIQKYRNDLLGKDASVSIDVDDSKAKSKVSALISDINSRSATINVNVVYSESGNKPKGYHSGGLLAGYGGGDRIHALLEPGEFVFRKEAVRAIGLGQLMKMNRVGQNIAIQRNSSINQLNIPKFASGGMVGGSPITINVPGSRPIQMVGSRESAMALANLLTRTSRSL